MDFTLSDEQLALQETAGRFARQEIAPVAAEYDQSGEFPHEIMKKAWELGLSALSIRNETVGSWCRGLCRRSSDIKLPEHRLAPAGGRTNLSPRLGSA